MLYFQIKLLAKNYIQLLSAEEPREFEESLSGEKWWKAIHFSTVSMEHLVARIYITDWHPSFTSNSCFTTPELPVSWYRELTYLQCFALFSLNLLFYHLCQVPKPLNPPLHSLMRECCVLVLSCLLAKERSLLHPITLRSLWGSHAWG